MLYAILIEVKAPYDEYDRLAALTQQQASRPEGFLMVLAYAKQWLLSDCLDGIAGDTYTLASDDDDDDDEFEDAITPPSLSVRAGLAQGVQLVFFSRDRGDSAGVDSRLWVWTLGHSWASVKQSCVEDELQLTVESLTMRERNRDGGREYRIIDHAPTVGAPASPFLFFKGIIPAYQSRLVGHQPVLDLQMQQKTVVALTDETLVQWMTLFAPVYLWWTQWNLSHPSKLVVHDEARIAPISNMSVALESVQVLFSVHDQFCFGAELSQMRGDTRLSDDEKSIVSHFRLSSLRAFSVRQDLASLQSATSADVDTSLVHDMLVVNDMSLVKTSQSRTHWSVDAHSCMHANAATDVLFHHHHEQPPPPTESGNAMYCYKVELPAVSVDWHIDEVEMLSWIVGKWVFFLPDAPLDRADRNLHLRSGKSPTMSLCYSQWSVSVPQIKVRVSDSHRASFELLTRDLRYETRRCSTTSSQRVAVSAMTLSEGSGVVLFGVEGNVRRSSPAVSMHSRVHRYYDDDRRGDASVLYFVGEATETSVILERAVVMLYLPAVDVALKWVGSCYDRYNIGFILSTSFGYDKEKFRNNLASLKAHESVSRVKTTADYHDESIVNLLMPQGCKVSLLHPPPVKTTNLEGVANGESSPRPVEIGAIEWSSLSLQSRLRGGTATQDFPEIKGTVRNLQVKDLAVPVTFPSTSSVMPNRQFIGSNQSEVGESVDMGPFGLKNVVDFVVTAEVDGEHEYAAESQGGAALRTVVRVRLDSVCMVYLHRVFKQFYHYVADHVLAILANPFDQAPSSEKAAAIFQSNAIDVSQLPESVDEVLRVYQDAFARSEPSVTGLASLQQRVWFELVANDLTFVLPRNSFSSDSILLHCTNARFWSSGVDSANSDFLQTGSFGDESRLSQSSAISDAHMAKAQQTRRTELRNTKRLVKNQRSRLLSNRSQLYIDLKNATQQAQNYLHEGFEALPEAEEAVKIIHHKIVVLDQQLDQLAAYLKEVEEAIEVATAEGEALNNGGRDSMVFMASGGLRGRTASMAQSEAMRRIRDAVTSMSQSLMTPLFIAEDAEFHDARTTTEALAPSTSTGVDMSKSSMGLFEFELVDLSGTTSGASVSLFHHALLTGRIESELESLSEATLSSYYGVNLSVNELSVSASQEQYTVLVGAIYENFKEVSSVVNEDTYPLCATCGGHHDVDEFCNAIWVRIPIKVADAALRISSGEHSIADLFWEQLELAFVLRTDDSLELTASALTFTALDVRPTRCPTASEIIRPLAGDGLQIVYNQKSNWTDSVYSLKLNNTNCLLIYPAIREVVAYFLDPIFADGAFLQCGEGFMSPTMPEWRKMDVYIDSDGCLVSLLEEFDKTDSRALVLLTDITLAYSTCQKCDDVVDMKKCHFALDQQGIYFSQLPDLQVSEWELVGICTVR